jgi:hypothetical protein
MRYLFDTVYVDLSKSDSTSSEKKANQSNKKTTRSLLDKDFEDDNNADELELYISEKSAKKDAKILEWWKVRQNNLKY